jgi:SAM-dependent methyltransferase
VSTKTFFDAIARRYDRDYALSGAVSRQRMARVLEQIANKRRVLVLGIGTGRELPALLDAGHEPTGIDDSAAMIAECNKRSRTVPIVQADFYAPLRFPAASFDAVIALHGTLAHPPREGAHPALASEIARVLAVGGVFVAEVPAAEGLAKLGAEVTGATTFVHRDDAAGVTIEGVAFTAEGWRAAFAPALVARIEPLGDVEHLVVAEPAITG